jgi:ubiquinone/menaquinone biosynthesis C-methylase UbiE
MRHNRSMSNVSFRLMSLIHDNPLRSLLDRPENALTAAGVTSGQKVLEVGCGPGYFTIAAGKIVGDEGTIYSIDIHPLAIKTTGDKVKKADLANIQVLFADAADTGLSDESIDLVFLFGVAHSLPMGNVLPELYRILKAGGIMAIETFGPVKPERYTGNGMFNYLENKGRIQKFKKTG